MKMLHIFVGDWHRPTRARDVFGTVALLVAGVVVLAAGHATWWAYLLIGVGAIGTVVLGFDLRRFVRQT